MRRIFSLLSLLALATMACNLVTAPATETPSAVNQPIETATSLPVKNEAAVPTEPIQNQAVNFSLVSDAVYPSDGNISYVSIPAGSCANLAAT